MDCLPANRLFVNFVNVAVHCVSVYECVVFLSVCVRFIANLRMVFSQWCISCWHLDKCLPSRADLPFMLNQERTTQNTATFGVCVCGLTCLSDLSLDFMCGFTNPESNAESEHVFVFTWSRQLGTPCRCYTWPDVSPSLQQQLCAGQEARPWTGAPDASNQQTAWAPAPPYWSPGHKRGSAKS